MGGGAVNIYVAKFAKFGQCKYLQVAKFAKFGQVNIYVYVAKFAKFEFRGVEGEKNAAKFAKFADRNPFIKYLFLKKYFNIYIHIFFYMGGCVSRGGQLAKFRKKGHVFFTENFFKKSLDI